MGKKKAFIDKKKSQHFHVVHRSQRDPRINDPEASKYVLLSSTKRQEIQHPAELETDYADESSDDDSLPELIEHPRPPKFYNNGFAGYQDDLINELGMVNDGYDYSKHMKETGHGVFYSASGNFESNNQMGRRVDLPQDVLPPTCENDRMLEAITLTTDVMDSDMKEALQDVNAFEDLDDDFISQATTLTTNVSDEFDYDAHIQRLLDAASGVPKYAGQVSDSENDDFDEDSVENPDETNEDLNILDEMFDKMILEYDDEKIGELEEEEGETRGNLILEGDLLDDILQDYVSVQQQIMDEEGRVGNPLRQGNHLQEIIQECDNRRRDDLNDVDEEAEETFPDVDQEVNLYVDYLTDRKREADQWDCETIVSTYSNLDNHPTIIDEPCNKKKSPLAESFRDQSRRLKASSSTIIQLSSKTGMPLGILPTRLATVDENIEVTDEEPVMLTRSKTETKDEKKERKLLVKDMKKKRREEKKATKNAFKAEECRQSKMCTGQPLTSIGGNVTVFRF